MRLPPVTRGQRLIITVFSASIHTSYLKKLYFWRNNILQSVTLFKRKRTFAESGGRNRRAIHKKRFLLYPWFEVWKISSKRMKTMWRSLCLYMRMDGPCCTHLHKHTAWEYCFFVHSCKVFSRHLNQMNKTGLTLPFYNHRLILGTWVGEENSQLIWRVKRQRLY